MRPYTWSHMTTTVRIPDSASEYKRPDVILSLQIISQTGTGPAHHLIQTHTA